MLVSGISSRRRSLPYGPIWSSSIGLPWQGTGVFDCDFSRLTLGRRHEPAARAVIAKAEDGALSRAPSPLRRENRCGPPSTGRAARSRPRSCLLTLRMPPVLGTDSKPSPGVTRPVGPADLAWVYM